MRGFAKRLCSLGNRWDVYGKHISGQIRKTVIRRTKAAANRGGMKMKSPCEEVVWEVLPGIRAAVAEELVRRGVSQKEVSKMLGITPPAVSQYVSKKRGYSIEISDEVKLSISRLADDLIQNKVEDLTSRICEVCKELRGEESACKPERCR